MRGVQTKAAKVAVESMIEDKDATKIAGKTIVTEIIDAKGFNS